MIRQNLVLPYLSQKWYGSCRACRTGGAAHSPATPLSVTMTTQRTT